MEPVDRDRWIARAERRVGFSQCKKSAVKTMQFVESRPLHGILIKELQSFIIGHLLPAIDKRHAIPGGAEDGEPAGHIAHAFVFTAAMGVLIGVGGKKHAQTIFWTT